MIIEEDVLGIKQVKGFYNRLKEEFRTGPEIIVDFRNVRRIDLSVVQVLVALNRNARNEGKTVKLKSISEDVRSQMNLCGLKI